MIYAVNKRTKEHKDITGWSDVMIGSYASNTDWFINFATPDGWIERQGGECPLPDGVNHQVKTRDGCKSEIVDTPGCFRWSHWGDYSDIIAYRPVLDEPRQATLAGAKLWQDAEGTIPCREGGPVGRVGEPPAWNGEGLPPAGCEVEALADDEWVRAEWFKKHNGEHAVFFIRSRALGWAKDIRPIRSKKDRAVEEMAKAAEEGLGHASGLIECMTAASGIYCAIRDGRVPGITLEETS